MCPAWGAKGHSTVSSATHEPSSWCRFWHGKCVAGSLLRPHFGLPAARHYFGGLAGRGTFLVASEPEQTPTQTAHTRGKPRLGRRGARAKQVAKPSRDIPGDSPGDDGARQRDAGGVCEQHVPTLPPRALGPVMGDAGLWSDSTEALSLQSGGQGSEYDGRRASAVYLPLHRAPRLRSPPPTTNHYHHHPPCTLLFTCSDIHLRGCKSVVVKSTRTWVELLSI